MVRSYLHFDFNYKNSINVKLDTFCAFIDLKIL